MYFEKGSYLDLTLQKLLISLKTGQVRYSIKGLTLSTILELESSLYLIVMSILIMWFVDYDIIWNLLH